MVENLKQSTIRCKAIAGERQDVQARLRYAQAQLADAKIILEAAKGLQFISQKLLDEGHHMEAVESICRDLFPKLVATAGM